MKFTEESYFSAVAARWKAIELASSTPFPSDKLAFTVEGGFCPLIVKEIVGGFIAQSPLFRLASPKGTVPGTF